MVVGVHELFQSQALGKPAGMHSSLGGARVSTPQYACSRDLACYNNALTSKYTDTDRKDRWNQVATHHGNHSLNCMTVAGVLGQADRAASNAQLHMEGRPASRAGLVRILST